MSKRYSFGAKLLLLTTSSAMTLVGAEYLMRLLNPQSAYIVSPGLQVPDPATGFRYQPGHRGYISSRIEFTTPVKINGFGLRGPDLDLPGDRPRMLVLGDSFVFGYGVEAEEAFPALLESALLQRGDNVEVVNAATAGYGTVNEVAWLKHYGLPLEPDFVVLGVFLGNDLRDNGRSLADSWAAIAPTRSWHRPVTHWLYDHSHLYVVVRQITTNLRREGRFVSRDSGLSLGQKYEGNHEHEVAATAKALDELAEIGRREGIGLFAILIPDPVQVEPERQTTRDRLARENPDLDLTYPNKVFSRLLEARGIPYTDLTGPFAADAPDGNRYFFPLDGHWTRAGHKLAAELVAPIVGLLVGDGPAPTQRVSNDRY